MTLSHLLDLLKEIEDVCSGCNRCGMCQTVCPVFSLSKHEGDAARGKLALLDGLSREILKRPNKVLDRLNRCLLCGACERSCSRQVPLTEIFIKARIILNAYTGLSPFKKLIFRTVLTHPALFEGLVRLSSRFQALFLKTKPDHPSIKETRHLAPFLNSRKVPALPDRSFRASLNLTQPSRSGQRVLFFTGCLIDKMFPQVGHACLTVLQAAGADAHVLPDEACCGIPALASGDRKAFDRLQSHTLDHIHIQDYDAVVTACATCTATLKTLWPRMHDGDNHTLNQIASKTMDITEFILTRTAVGQSGFTFKPFQGEKTLLTWHDPCHLKGKGRALSSARNLLKSLPPYDFHDMKGAGLCCGYGGSFNLSHYSMSLDLGQIKAGLILASGVSTIATGCPGCMLQLIDMLARQGSDIRVRHIMELVAESV